MRPILGFFFFRFSLTHTKLFPFAIYPILCILIYDFSSIILMMDTPNGFLFRPSDIFFDVSAQKKIIIEYLIWMNFICAKIVSIFGARSTFTHAHVRCNVRRTQFWLASVFSFCDLHNKSSNGKIDDVCVGLRLSRAGCACEWCACVPSMYLFRSVSVVLQSVVCARWVNERALHITDIDGIGASIRVWPQRVCACECMSTACGTSTLHHVERGDV